MQINDFIYHEKYGIGKITSLDGRFITVDFSGTPKHFLKSGVCKFLKNSRKLSFLIRSMRLVQKHLQMQNSFIQSILAVMFPVSIAAHSRIAQILKRSWVRMVLA